MEQSDLAKFLENVVAEYRNTSTQHVNKSDLIISEWVHLEFISLFALHEFDKLRKCAMFGHISRQIFICIFN